MSAPHSSSEASNSPDPTPREAILLEPVPPQGLTAFFLDSEYRLRTFWRFALFGVCFVAIELAAAIVTVLVMLVYIAFTAPGGDVQQLLKSQLESNVALLAVAALPQAILALGLVVVFRKFLDRRSITSMGFVWPRRDLSTSLIAGLVLGAAPIILGTMVIVQLGGYEIRAATPSALTYLLVVCLVLAAFHEEVIFRSYLLQNLFDIRRPVFGVIFTSLLFWLVHAMNPSAWSSPLVGLNLFLAGVELSLAYMVSRNIWFPTAVHFAWNLAQGVVLGLPISGISVDGFFQLQPTDKCPGWITGGSFGFEASIVCTSAEVFVICILLVVLLYSRDSYAEKKQNSSREPVMGE